MNSKLFRGITVNDDVFQDMHLQGVVLKNSNPAQYNEKGQSVVGDGNEYGTYMTDNFVMCEEVYGKPHYTGRKLSNLRLGVENQMIAMPKIRIIYEIDPEKAVGLRRPRICFELEGHYNNGYGGDEWIADEILSDGYRVVKLTIGDDLLHRKEDFIIENNDDINDIQQKINAILSKRQFHLLTFEKAIQNMGSSFLRIFNRTYKNVFIELFGDNGTFYKNLDEIDTSTEVGKCEFLLAYESQNSDLKLGMPELSYFTELKKRIIDGSDKKVEDFIDYVLSKKLESPDELTDGREKTSVYWAIMKNNKYKKYKELLEKKSIQQNGSQPGEE